MQGQSRRAQPRQALAERIELLVLVVVAAVCGGFVAARFAWRLRRKQAWPQLDSKNLALLTAFDWLESEIAQ